MWNRDQDDAPRVIPWLKREVEARQRATSALHESYILSASEREILQHCDGSVRVSGLIERALRDISVEMIIRLIDSLEQRGFFVR